MACKKWIHTPEPKGDPYWDRVRAVAEGLHSDGCTLVADWYLDACYEHDIHWRTGQTLAGAKITTAEANTRFRRVIQSRSKLGRLNPVSWVRWVGVTLGARILDPASNYN
jgi:hypothetical protein